MQNAHYCRRLAAVFLTIFMSWHITPDCSQVAASKPLHQLKSNRSPTGGVSCALAYLVPGTGAPRGRELLVNAALVRRTRSSLLFRAFGTRLPDLSVPCLGWPLSKRSSRHHRSPGGAHAPRPLVYHLRWLWPGGCEHSCELWRSSSSQTSRESSFDYVPRKPCRNSLLGNLPCDVIDRPCIALPSSILRPRPAKGHQAARVDRTCDMCFRVPTYALRLVPPQSRALLP